MSLMQERIDKLVHDRDEALQRVSELEACLVEEKMEKLEEKRVWEAQLEAKKQQEEQLVQENRRLEERLAQKEGKQGASGAANEGAVEWEVSSSDSEGAPVGGGPVGDSAATATTGTSALPSHGGPLAHSFVHAAAGSTRPSYIPSCEGLAPLLSQHATSRGMDATATDEGSLYYRGLPCPPCSARPSVRFITPTCLPPTLGSLD